MRAIDRPGTYRGNPTEWAVSETINGFPQLVIRLNALEKYDEDGTLGPAVGVADSVGKYVPWNYGMDMIGYFVLVTDKGATLNVDQIKAALGWDGQTFASLQNGEYANTMVMFRVENRVYQNVPRLQVTWIDKFDASPTRSIKQLDDGKFSNMQARWLGQLGKGQAPTPAVPAAPGAPAPAPAAPAPTAAPIPVAAAPAPVAAAPLPAQVAPGAPQPVAPAPAVPAIPQAAPVAAQPVSQPQPEPAAGATPEATAKKKRGRGRPKGSGRKKAEAAAPVAAGPPVAAPPEPVQPTVATVAEQAAADNPPALAPPPAAVAAPQQTQANTPCTKEEAWNAVGDAAPKDLSQDLLSDIWIGVVQRHAPEGDDSKLTDENWGDVRSEILIAIEQGGTDDIPF